MKIVLRLVQAYGRIMVFIETPRVSFKGIGSRHLDYALSPTSKSLFFKKPTQLWICKCKHDHWEDHYNAITIDAVLV